MNKKAMFITAGIILLLEIVTGILIFNKVINSDIVLIVMIALTVLVVAAFLLRFSYLMKENSELIFLKMLLPNCVFGALLVGVAVLGTVAHEMQPNPYTIDGTVNISDELDKSELESQIEELLKENGIECDIELKE